MVRHALHERVQMDVSPPPRERQLPFRRQRLVAEENDQVVQQCTAYFGQHLVRQVARQVGPVDLRPERPGNTMRRNVTVLAVVQHLVHGIALPPSSASLLLSAPASNLPGAR